MKKFFLSLGIGLFAFLGVLFGVGGSSSNLNTFKEVQKSAVSPTTNLIDFYFDENVNDYKSINEILLLNLNENSLFYYYDLNNNLISVSLDFLNSSGTIPSQFTFRSSFYTNSNTGSNIFTIGTSSENVFPIIGKYNYEISDNGLSYRSNIWYCNFVDISESNLINIEIKGFRIENFTYVEELEGINQLLDPYIGNLTSLNGGSTPVDPIPPSPPSNDPLNDISTTINGVIDWFVDLFNGLSDIFVITDSSGAFAGFSLWGNILFIQVSLGLVIIVLRWVISLIKGI